MSASGNAIVREVCEYDAIYDTLSLPDFARNVLLSKSVNYDSQIFLQGRNVPIALAEVWHAAKIRNLYGDSCNMYYVILHQLTSHM